MPVVRARHVICILHDDLDALAKVIKRFPGFVVDREFSTEMPDARMRGAFEASMDRVSPSFTKADWTTIERHKAVGYVLSPRITRANDRKVSTSALRLVDAALGAGARAAKSESSGIAHGARRWRTLAGKIRGKGTDAAAAEALYQAWVRRPIGDDDVLYTCGMHLLGLPDVEMANDVAPLEGVQWLDAFARYELHEVTQNKLRAGHTFRPDAEVDRRTLERRDCARYEADDYFFNPLGYWRIGTLAPVRR